MATSFENVMEKIGFGLYQKFLIAIAAGTALSNGAVTINLMFALPILACDMELGEDEILWIGFTFSLGTAIGGYLMCCWADISGRKSIISISLAMVFAAMFSLGFSCGYTLSITLTFILGVGVAANSTVTKIHLAEVLLTSNRGYFLVLIDFFWSLGYFISLGLCILFKSTIMETRKMDVRLVTWRIMLGVAGFPYIVLSCASSLIKSSPRYKFANKNPQSGMSTLRYIYAVNNSKHGESIPFQENDLKGSIEEINYPSAMVELPRQENLVKQIKKIFFLTFKSTQKRFLKVLIILTIIKLMLFPEVAVVHAWLTKVLKFTDKNCTINALDLLYLEGNNNTFCHMNVTEVIYKDFATVGAGIPLGQIISIIFIDLVGRKICFIVGCTLCGICGLTLMYALNIIVLRYIFAVLHMVFYSLVDSILGVLIIEEFPTFIRGTTSGMIFYLPRITSMFMKRFFNGVLCQSSYIGHVTLLFSAAALGYFLPELRRRPMVE